MNKPLADYVKLPEFDEYKEWFKDFADLKREDGIVQVTWKTNDGPMHHCGMSHRAMRSADPRPVAWTGRTRSSSSPTSVTTG